MIALINRWESIDASGKYLAPLQLIAKDYGTDQDVYNWLSSAITWGYIVMDHPGYIDYVSYDFSDTIVYTVSYYESMDSLTALRARPDYGDFISARQSYILAKSFNFQEKIITLEHPIGTIEELVELVNIN